MMHNCSTVNGMKWKVHKLARGLGRRNLNDAQKKHCGWNGMEVHNLAKGLERMSCSRSPNQGWKIVRG
jgi:hypothetical protein